MTETSSPLAGLSAGSLPDGTVSVDAAAKSVQPAVYPFVFSVCCLVTRYSEYGALRKALKEQGFNESNCEFLVCDNSAGNRYSAFDAIRAFLRQAKGKYVLIIHQDAIPLESAEALLGLVAQVEKHGPHWGVIGNCGRQFGGRASLALEIDGRVTRVGQPFVQVAAVDENMMLVRSGAGLTVSRYGEGFHMYAFDLCSVAARLGYSTYVVDHLWRHDSAGTIDDGYLVAKKRMEDKMRDYHRGQFAPTSSTTLCWSSSPFQQAKARALSILTIGHRKHRAIRRKMWWQGIFTNPLFVFYIIHYLLRDAWCWVKRGLERRGRGAGSARAENLKS
jgi:hypothetical protein